ncbi:mechanosensitive ion channel family protein [Cytophaga hutchinsonii]|uniref:Mechanosensitive ion channel protein n=1 Tax=Cytophaga hutchinsonii (strain ATCC 33406 / DSM 1761 / CIP 103989 / NBRC 15051 / NCIMB 9469 / D465) TaxID=269798 RepID=A0A6N4SVG5_CYTH3|nr:mechanosensitive ion channel domain-containing protein [Cytophaga hutchinsonii]ABG60579.1 mechanosensitive ion channel protein [Cytophaga hutchinsonii ATCC 33406]SFX89574.1 Mechanosensitive ion channel [Cytophaga hutchinsonii ATCC 33406]
MNRFLLIVAVQFLMIAASGQTLSAKPDTALQEELLYQKSLIKDEAGKRAEQFNEDKLVLNQELALEKVLQAARIAKQYLKSDMDTAAWQIQIDDIQKKYIIAGDGVFSNKGTIQTHRNLTVTSKILWELLNELNARKVKINIYKHKLVDCRNDIDSLSSAPALFIVSEDSVRLRGHLQRLSVISREVRPVNNALEQSINRLQKLKEQIDYTVFEIMAALDHIEQSEIELSSRSFEKEMNYLWEPSIPERPFHEIIYQSLEKDSLTLKYYAANNSGRVILLLIFISMSVYFISSLKRKAQNEHLIRSDFSDQLVIKYPLLSALMIVINIFQFIFPNPPFIFNCLLWVVSTFCLTIIYMNYITKYWMCFWLLMWMLFLLACGNNLILQASMTERWIMLAIASAGLSLAAFIASKKRREELREKSTVYFIIFIIIIETASIAANMYGRFNISKSLLTSGFINLIIAISFLWTVRLINEGLSLASRMFRTPERRLFYINFSVIGHKAPFFLYALLVIGWFIVFARNFYEFNFVTQPVTDFIHSEIHIGNYSFSIYSVALFIVILLVAAIVSKIISFFGADISASAADNRRPTLGSWILLIRITIIVTGLLVAFAAAGIPLDKATFVLGALGVGIGFGLQSLVQNLVSGIILTFEKPVNVGDFVEIKGQKGTIKSIGFRSSTLLTIEGSKVIIPNGEILNDNVTNWTHERGMNRRTQIVIGVAYGTDLESARKILLDLVADQDSILKNPTPFVLISDFDSSSIRLQLFFWTSTPFAGNFVKSELIIAIQNAFKTNSIQFPHQDIFIKPFPSNEKSSDS